MPAGIYGNLIRLDTGNGIVEEVLERVPLYAGVSPGRGQRGHPPGPAVPFPTGTAHFRHRRHLRRCHPRLPRVAHARRLFGCAVRQSSGLVDTRRVQAVAQSPGPARSYRTDPRLRQGPCFVGLRGPAAQGVPGHGPEGQCALRTGPGASPRSGRGGIRRQCYATPQAR